MHRLIIILCLSLFGCSTTKLLYYWDEYEDLIYDMYVNPGKADPGVQIVKLTEDIEKTHAQGLRVPPGTHAHLGYMHYLQGNLGVARYEFKEEKRLFPESKTFIDGLLERMDK